MSSTETKNKDKGEIKLLSPELINQIAAGEVTERPASAVKELIDNAIDAGATKVNIELLSNDGRSFRVTDNGSGIDPDQIELAFTIHATSKISDLDDLSNIITKGFRGEALASIASVSDLICLTKHQSSDQAIKVTFNNKGALVKTPVAFNQGTSFEVRELFRKVPARLNFLKKPEREVQAIVDIVRELAIAHPEIAFDLKGKTKKILSTSGSGNWEQTVSELLNEPGLKYLESVDGENQITLKGLIAPLSSAKANYRNIVTLVNQRPIHCPMLRKAIREVFGGLLPRNKYPTAVLSLELSPQSIDVNVHPNKSEIRYRQATEIYLLVKRSLEKHLILNSGVNEIIKEESLVYSPDTDPAAAQVEIAGLKDSSAIPSSKTAEELIKEVKKPESIQEKTKETTESSISDSPAAKELAFKRKLQEILERKREVSAKVDIDSQEGDSAGNSLDFAVSEVNLSFGSEDQIGILAQTGNFKLHGDISTEHEWLKKSFRDYMQGWLDTIHQKFIKEEQGKLIESSGESSGRVIPPMTLLEQVWRRDNWRCVYCGKHLLHPSLMERLISVDPDASITRLDKDNKLTSIHPAKDHIATHDHLIPYSKAKGLHHSDRNLYACCLACNQSKSDSTNYQKWQPKIRAPWSAEGQKIGNKIVKSGEKNAEILD